MGHGAQTDRAGQRHPVIRVLLWYLMAVGVGIASFFMVMFWLRVKTEEISVPDVTGTSYEAAWEKLHKVKLGINRTERYNNAIIAGQVMSQSPPAGAVVRQGRNVNVVVSLGSEIVKIPLVTGRDAESAGAILRNTGLSLGKISRIWSDKPEGRVLVQTPAGGSRVKRHLPVSLLVSAGFREKSLVMPRLIGLDDDHAYEILNDSGLSVGIVNEQLDVRKLRGTVLDQNPRAGSRVTEEERIVLWVSTDRQQSKKQSIYRPANLFYRTPMGFFPRAVKVEITDFNGRRVIYDNQKVNPGSNLSFWANVRGRAVARIYYNNELVEEKDL